MDVDLKMQKLRKDEVVIPYAETQCGDLTPAGHGGGTADEGILMPPIGLLLGSLVLKVVHGTRRFEGHSDSLARAKAKGIVVIAYGRSSTTSSSS